ncbi:MAG: adenylyltransferase/cytidyltransferase family protein [Candidatus Aenigmarchaeota archaeon]|nr:adenylyltransferase/cytidyltransferase family protein [Candidatus Aenigmarchaeota archaeon]
MKKIKTLDQLEKIVGILKNEGKTIVTTNGVFDILHVGHVRYLQEAKSTGDVLIVGLNSDESVKKIKGPKRPIVPEEERLEMLTALDCVDYVFTFSETTPHTYLEVIKPHIHVKGGDYTPERVIERTLLEKINAKLYLANNIQNKSTTNIVKKILDTHKD